MKSFFYQNGYQDAQDELPINSDNPHYIEGYADFQEGKSERYESIPKVSDPVQLSLFDFDVIESETYEIFLDMDGVIVDLALELQTQMNKILSTSNKYSKKFWKKHPDFQLNTIDTSYLKEIFIAKDLGIPLAKSQKDIRRLTYKPLAKNLNLWAKLPIYKGASDFVKYLLSQWKVTILSAPIDTESIKGKELWLDINFPELENRLFESEKFIYAHPRGILIDDRPKNIALWQEHGGIAILHDGDFSRTIEQLNNIINKK